MTAIAILIIGSLALTWAAGYESKTCSEHSIPPSWVFAFNLVVLVMGALSLIICLVHDIRGFFN